MVDRYVLIIIVVNKILNSCGHLHADVSKLPTQHAGQRMYIVHQSYIIRLITHCNDNVYNIKQYFREKFTVYSYRFIKMFIFNKNNEYFIKQNDYKNRLKIVQSLFKVKHKQK